MRITDVEVIPFEVARTAFRHGGAIEETTITQTVTRITTGDGTVGYCLGGAGHGDRDGLSITQRERITSVGQSLLVGEDPLDRERFWRWFWSMNVDEPILSVLDIALWDLAGRNFGVPVHKLAGGCRASVPAYASTFPNLGAPEVYADHAAACLDRGYQAYKIHPYYFWNPATGEEVPGRPSHVEHDLAVIQAVANRVGDEMVLMYDPWGTYGSFAEARQVGRELVDWGYYWYEHPVEEYRVSSYERLQSALDLPICSPEIAAGSVYTRADWIKRGVTEISRIDTLRGGITGCLKLASICEAYDVRCEIHMSGFANLQVLGATSPDTCEYYERGLLAPGLDYEQPPPYLETIGDPMDDSGMVTIPDAPGIGYELDWDYIAANRIDD